MSQQQNVNLFWFRRDLRINDNHGLYQALSSNLPVLPIFIFDSNILNDLEDQDSRVSFILKKVQELQELFESHGSSLWIYHGKPLNAFKRLAVEYNVDTVFTNEDYEPYALDRDKQVSEYLETIGVKFKAYKDQVIFHKNEIVKDDGNPYSVFTPYSKKWLSNLTENDLRQYPSESLVDKFVKIPPFPKTHHYHIGFRPGTYSIPEQTIEIQKLKEYGKKRDLPALHATSLLGIHLRFGTISIRQLTELAQQHSPVFLNELIWRNFYMDILWHFPHVVNNSFKPAYDHIPWINSEKDFKRWCEGKTGFPMVDAGMRQLNQTGYMHNRVRMITASFLCKHLLIDWRWGEAYFAEKLLDYELASNNGGWQWASGSGCDAAPYFRVFNPELQQKKFDPDFQYIKKWIPEFGTDNYPHPIIDHKKARDRALETYKEALNKG